MRLATKIQDEAEPLDFRALYEGEFDYVWNSLRRLGAPPKDLEDLVHDTFVTAHRRLDTYERSRPLRPWLFGIAYRTLSDFRKKAHHTKEVMDDSSVDAVQVDGAPDDALEAKEKRALVMEAMESVELDRRAVMVMHDLEGHSVPYIAEVLSIPLNTAYSRLRLARAEFAKAVARLRPAGGEP